MKYIKYKFVYLAFLIILNPINLINPQGEKDSNTEADQSQENENEENKSHRGLTLNAYPYVYYTPETELAFGAGGIMIFFTGDDKELLPSKVTLGGYYSTNGQYNISIKPVLYFNRNKNYLELPMNYGHFVDKFWGIGNNTPETGNESYTMDQFAITFKFQVPPIIFFAERAGIIFAYNNTEIDDKQSNSLLLNDVVFGSNGGEIFGIGTDLLWDKRDNIFFPNKGTYQYFKLIVYPDFSDFVFYEVEMDVKYFTAFSPDHVLAFNFYFDAVSGETPFYKLPALGGSSRMRGYFEGRYRDNIYSMMQLEYRQYFWWKLGFVVFAGIGDVTNELTKFKLNEFKYSFGAGLRFLFNKEEKVNLRVDIGIGQDGNSGIYFGIEEAF